MKLRVNGKTWNIYRTVLRGLCTPSERAIDIDPRLRPRRRLEVLIHEILHALYQEADEALVTRSAKTLAKALWRDHWRRKHG